MHYKLVKIIIDALGLTKVIINVLVQHHGLSDSIITDQGFLFISKFWFWLYNFLGIKKKLSTAFHLQTDGQIERQNSIMKAYLRAFVNWKLNN